MRRPLAFTVIEVLVSIVLLTAGILVAMSVLTFGLKASTGSAQLTEATALSRTMMEIALQGGPRSPLLPGNVYNPDYDNTWRKLYSPGAVAPPFVLTDFVRTGDPRDVKRFIQRAQEFEVRLGTAPNPAAGPGVVNVTLDVRWFDRLGRRSMTTYGIQRNG